MFSLYSVKLLRNWGPLKTKKLVKKLKLVFSPMSPVSQSLRLEKTIHKNNSGGSGPCHGCKRSRAWRKQGHSGVRWKPQEWELRWKPWNVYLIWISPRDTSGKGPPKSDRHGLSLSPLLTQSVTHDLDSPLCIGNSHLDEALRQTFKFCFKFASFIFITTENES